MLQKTLILTLVLVVLQFVSAAFAKDYELKNLPQAKAPMYDISKVSNQISYYDFVRTTLGPQIQKMAPQGRLDNEAELAAGHGVSVRLSTNNYNIHINFPNASLGGRSYGWTKGQVGDWSDAMYLDRLSEVVLNNNDRDLAGFYELLIEMLGACNSSNMESLRLETQRVAANFLAIYTAEAYRAMVPDAHMNWDDALLEVSLLGAFHGGQTHFTKFYLGEFSGTSKMQNSGVYGKMKPGPTADEAKDKAAQMRDYWQFSANPTSKQSGINITRSDFEKMGQAITKYEVTVANNRTLDKIIAVTGGDKSNVIKSISQFFTTGKVKDLSQIDGLAKDVANFLLDVRADADKITEWELNNER